jgi:hypothetical protein
MAQYEKEDYKALPGTWLQAQLNFKEHHRMNAPKSKDVL